MSAAGGEVVLLDRGQGVLGGHGEAELGGQGRLGGDQQLGADEREQPRRLVPARLADVVLELDQGGDQGVLGRRAGRSSAARHGVRRRRWPEPAVAQMASVSDATFTRFRSVCTPAISAQLSAGTRKIVAPALSAPATFSWMPPIGPDPPRGVDGAGSGHVPIRPATGPR